LREPSFRTLLLASLAAFAFAAHAFAQEKTVQFGVLGLFHPKEIVLEPYGNQALLVSGIGSGDSAKVVINGEPNKRRLVFRAEKNGVTVNGKSAEKWIATARDGGAAEFALTVPGKLRRVYRGEFAVELRRNELVAIVGIELETAVASIVAAEMNERAPLEALKAQAVATRSFLAAGGRHSEFEFCDSTHCQFLKSPPAASSRVWSAVAATRGWVMTFESKPLAALYSSRCGGRTRTLHDAGYDSIGAKGAAYPYYAVECPWCRKHPLEWQRTFDAEHRPPAPGDERQRIATVRQWGWSALPGDDFKATEENGGWRINGHNAGHGIGMCQYGAIGMAASGIGYSEILAHYYPNTSLSRLR